MKAGHIAIIIIGLFTSSLIGQINTESMRDSNEKIGVEQNLNFSFTYISGSSEFMILNGFYRIDYHSNSKWHGFFIVKYDRSFEKAQEDFSHRGFGHLRTIKRFLPQIYLESFIQKEFNYFIDLENRELAGLGLRFKMKDQLYIGIGGMHEKEIYKQNSERTFLKSTNYINHAFQMMENVEITNIIYYQFQLESMDQYRLLWDSTFNLQAAEWLSFHINLHYRYDISDLNLDGNSYFELTNGIGIYF